MATAKDCTRRRYGRPVIVWLEKETAEESSVRDPQAPGPSYFKSGSADLTTRESITARRAGIARFGLGGPLAMLVSMKPLTCGVPEVETARLVSISLGTLPTHSSRLTSDVSTAAAETPRSGTEPSMPSMPYAI